VGIQLSSILLGAERRRGIVFESEHGVTFGPAGPHEFGYFWSHWLRLSDSPTHHLNDGALGRIDRDGLQKALEQEILGSFNVPVVFKNVICGFQAGFLTALHPRSLFVHVKRSPFAVAASVLGCRFQRYGSYATWWSLKPSTFPELSLLSDPASQVVGQVLDCVAEIEEELDNSEVKSLVLSYEKLCADPEGSITQVFRACEEMDCMVTRNDDPLPRLVMASPQRLSLNALNDRGIAV
jgi:hypothetical protein